MAPSPLEWAVRVLSDSDDILVPVKLLWLELQEQGMGRGLSVDSFKAMLESDERFELFEGAEYGNGNVQEEYLMEELGFVSGPRVKLVVRELTVEDVTRLLRQSTENMLTALEGAWEVRPVDDPEAEQQLLDILTMAQRLKTEVDHALSGMEGEDERDD